MFDKIKSIISQDTTLYVKLRIRIARVLFIFGIFLYFGSLLMRQNDILASFFGPLAFLSFPVLMLFASNWAYWNIVYFVEIYFSDKKWIQLFAIGTLFLIVSFTTYLHSLLGISNLLS